jgi:hypothetical protein
MKTLSPKIRSAINREAHAYAQRLELKIRDRWISACETALDQGETHDAVLQRVGSLSRDMPQ